MAKNILVISSTSPRPASPSSKNGIIAELHIERHGAQPTRRQRRRRLLGKVTRVLPGPAGRVHRHRAGARGVPPRRGPDPPRRLRDVPRRRAQARADEDSGDASTRGERTRSAAPRRRAVAAAGRSHRRRDAGRAPRRRRRRRPRPRRVAAERRRRRGRRRRDARGARRRRRPRTSAMPRPADDGGVDEDARADGGDAGRRERRARRRRRRGPTTRPRDRRRAGERRGAPTTTSPRGTAAPTATVTAGRTPSRRSASADDVDDLARQPEPARLHHQRPGRADAARAPSRARASGATAVARGGGRGRGRDGRGARRTAASAAAIGGGGGGGGERRRARRARRRAARGATSGRAGPHLQDDADPRRGQRGAGDHRPGLQGPHRHQGRALHEPHLAARVATSCTCRRSITSACRKRIGSDKERARLRETIESMKPPSGGLIVRTVAEGLTKKQLKADVGYLVRLWGEIAKKREGAQGPDAALERARPRAQDRARPLHRRGRPDRHRRQARSTSASAASSRCSCPSALKDIIYYYGRRAHLRRLRHRGRDRPRARRARSRCPRGGYLIIDQAEALTAIDVNTGRFVGKGSQGHGGDDPQDEPRGRATRSPTSSASATSAASSSSTSSTWSGTATARRSGATLEELLAEGQGEDDAQPHLASSGLIEMTRKRTRESLGRLLHEPCFYCDGTGQLQSQGDDRLRDPARDPPPAADLPGYTVVVQRPPRRGRPAARAPRRTPSPTPRTGTCARSRSIPRTEYHLEQFDLSGK